MFKFILIGIAAIIAIFLIVAALQPADFRIARSTTIAAPSSAVFEQINDFRKWNDWSPWAKMDPNAKNSFEGPPSGVGAGFSWAGNSQVGEGRMTITDSKPNELVRMNLEFIKPFAATNVAEFTLKPEGDKTAVTWSMTGRNGFMGKAMGLIMNCDKMVGGQFEQGFANLKKIVEKPAQS
jgi:carbon monoxide dehydrogenase subunit G